MNVLQVWMVVGIPAIVLGLALFYGRSRVRTLFGYLVLLGAAGYMATVDRASAAVLGAIVALLYAAGRGGSAEAEHLNTSLIAVPDEVRRSARHPAP